MWSLTLERKNELLKKRDDKIAELKTLQAKTPALLWEDDLDEFIAKLDEVEKKEREDEAGTKPKEKTKAKLGRLKLQAAETLPSPVGRRVEPRINDEDRKKCERLDQAARNAKEGIKKERKKVKKEVDADELDKLANQVTKKGSLEERLGNSPDMIEKKAGKKSKTDGMKQTKLDFAKMQKKSSVSPKKKGGKRRNPWSDEEASGSGADSDEDIVATPPARSTSRRAAASMFFSGLFCYQVDLIMLWFLAKLNFKQMDESDEDNDSGPEVLHDNDMSGGNSQPEVVALSEDDDDNDDSPVKE